VNAVSRPARDLLVALALLALLLWWEVSGLDLTLTRWYGDVHGFALREHWLVRGVLHDGGRLLSVVGLTALLAWSALGDARTMARRLRWAWTSSVVMCLVVVPALKRLSSSSCPWDLDEFGGAADYVPHWMLALADGGPGHCFPSGHAVAAFAFVPLYFQWRGQAPRCAAALLITIVGVGALFGWAQLARGAHFASHTLWSIWLCWVVGAVAARWLDESIEPFAGSAVAEAGAA
jgi:membrane-associated PAP2 superfamily phosphatase